MSENPKDQEAEAAVDGPGTPYATRGPRPDDTPYDVAHAPHKPKPGVTVKVFAHREDHRDTCYHWSGEMDGVDRFAFSFDSEGEFPTPEDAEADCRKHLGELVDRLFPGGVMLASTHGFSMELQNLKFVRE